MYTYIVYTYIQKYTQTPLLIQNPHTPASIAPTSSSSKTGQPHSTPIAPCNATSLLDVATTIEVSTAPHMPVEGWGRGGGGGARERERERVYV